ncbi:syntaxin-1A [Caerostris extrusa]|uniref:Syntaxin-1A n=1 Tax=Caerostris extrusa TaxID=172846 RepID=A0AAV4N5B3_CAEEX|nr:syntaxin-1A [Caerostris extrusa]
MVVRDRKAEFLDVEDINNAFAFVNKGISDVIKIQSAILEFNETDETGADVSRINLDEIIGSKTDIFLQTVLPDYDVTHHFLSEVKKRHENFLKMENTIEELRDLFFDLALIVQVDASHIFLNYAHNI